MSIHAISWALKAQGLKSSTKFLLVCLADAMNESTALAYPSVAALSEATCQDRKTVLANIKELIAAGLIVDTGQRVGSTKQVIAYRINTGSNSCLKSTENGTGTENGTVPKFPINSTVFPPKTAVLEVKQSQKRDTEPVKKEEDKRRSSTALKKGSRIPEDFCLTAERMATAAAEKLDPKRTFENFRDYWAAAAGAKARKVDWDAAWRVWCRSDYNKPKSQSGKPAADPYANSI